MKPFVVRGIVATVVLVLLLCIGGLYAISRFDLLSAELTEPIPGSGKFGQPVEPLPDDIVALRPAVAAKGGFEGLLIRELARQAVLIAARDEMGLRTRDVVLREILPEASAASLHALDAHVISPPDGTMFVGIGRSGGKWGDIDFYKVAPERDGDRIAYIARQMEAASHDAFVERLVGVGYQPRKVSRPEAKPRASDSADTIAGPSPDVVERFDLISQYAAARAWHDAIRADGETPERLIGLVRAYANLGLLTSHHWSAGHKAFQARSLLYAERLLRLTGETPSSLRSRAYARALVGLPMLAVADLDTADAADANEAAPDWCAVVRAHAAGDPKELARHRFVGDDNARLLASVLILEDAILSGWPNRIQNAATAVVDVVPANGRARFTLLSRRMPLGVLRNNVDIIQNGAELWLYEPLVHSGVPLPIKLAQVPKDPTEEGPFRKKLIDGLINDERVRSDAAEPSFVVLGRLIEEEGILHARSVMMTYRSALGVESDEEYRETQPWYSHHPFSAVIRSFGPVEDGRGALGDLARTIVGEQLVPAEEEIHEMFASISPEAEKGRDFIRHNCDAVVSDLVWSIENAATEKDRRNYVRQLERVSPNSLVAARFLLALDPTSVADRIPDWERRFPGDASLMKVLAQWHSNEMRYAEAIRCLKDAILEQPEFETYEWVAAIYDSQGDDEGYIRAYTESMEERSRGLQHATAADRIADRLCRHERWQDALPYAIRAADSYSGWGLATAAYVHEALGDFDQAEAHVRAVSERYTSDAAWYNWCVRTGRGDLAAAEKQELVAQAEWRESPNSINHGADYELSFSALLHGRRAEALAGYRTLAEQYKGAMDAMFVALIADELGDTTTRDEFLTKAHERSGTNDAILGEVARVLRDDLDGHSFDVEQLARLIRENSPSSLYAGSRLYLLAWYLTNRDRDDEALPFYRIAASSPQVREISTILAGRYLVQHGHDPAERAGSLMSDEMIRAATLVKHGSGLSSSKPKWALARLDQALAIRPKYVTGLQWRAYVYTQEEQFRDALTDYDSLIAELPQSPQNYLDRGSLYVRLGDEGKAAADFERAVRLARSPQMPSLLSSGLIALATLHSSCRDPAVLDPERALQQAEEAVALGIAPEGEHARVKAIAMAAAGRFDEAINMAETAIRLCDESVHPWLEYQLARYRRHQRYERPDNWWRATPVAAGPVEATRE